MQLIVYDECLTLRIVNALLILISNPKLHVPVNITDIVYINLM